VTNLAPVALWPTPLREQLLELRDGIITRMERRGSIEPGQLPLLSGVAAAIAVLDRSVRMEAAAPAVVDATGAEIRLIVYRNGEAIAATPLSPVLAIQLGGELRAAAGLRLADDLAELRQKDSR
jgi:hypothetical protein